VTARRRRRELGRRYVRSPAAGSASYDANVVPSAKAMRIALIARKGAYGVTWRLLTAPASRSATVKNDPIATMPRDVDRVLCIAALGLFMMAR
jgi:hypothetical protein